MDKILLGKPVAQALYESTKTDILQNGFCPVMSLIQIGSDPASSYYIQNIIKQGKKLGCDIQLITLSSETNTSELLKVVHQCNINPDIHGIMIQKPLPAQIDDEMVNSAINPAKDIDGIHPLNLGKLFLEQTAFVPCTAAAVIELARYYNISFCGKHVVIIGRSNIVGKPLLGLLIQKHSLGNATVTICHSKTKEIQSITKTADIIIAAIGQPKFINADMIKQDSICIDVGINLIQDIEKQNVYVGDIDYQTCLEKSVAITPVPGGIGTITTAILLGNLTKAAFNSIQAEK